MSAERTSGYDILIQIAESAINEQLALAFLAGGMIPRSLSIPIDENNVTGAVDLNFTTPVADFDRPRGSMGLTLPFENSALSLTAPQSVSFAPLGGTIVIVDTIQVITENDSQIVAMNFNNGVSAVTVSFDSASAQMLQPLLLVAGLTLAEFRTLVAGIVLTQLQTQINRLPLSSPIPISDDNDPFTVNDIDVTTINDSSAADRDCLVLGLKMDSRTNTNINNVNTNFIPGNEPALIMISNFWLLARVIRPLLVNELGTDEVWFDDPLRLRRPVPVLDGQATLNSLEATVQNDRMKFEFSFTLAGPGWSARVDVTFYIEIELGRSGNLLITATEPSVDTDVDLEWWVEVATLGVATLVGGPVAAVVAAIVLVIVESATDSIVDALLPFIVEDEIEIPNKISLGPAGTGFEVTDLQLDDLELTCDIKTDEIPVLNHRYYTSRENFAVDLDAGTRSATVQPGSDLVWDTVTGLRANGRAGFTVVSNNYASLTPLKISRLPLTSTAISLSSIPVIDRTTGSPLFNAMRLGVQTAAGRYAKVDIYRLAESPTDVIMNCFTYDTPIPQLDIAGRWRAAQRGPVTETITNDCQRCRSSEVRWTATFEAWPRLVAFPVNYQWCLCGHILKEGEGEINTTQGKITYVLKGRRLQLAAARPGQDIDCELCVSAIDHKGMELFTCVGLHQKGLDKTCTQHREQKRANYEIEHLPISAELTAWRKLELSKIDTID